MHFIRSSGARNRGCFCSWAAVNSAAVGMGEQVGVPVVCLVLWLDSQVWVAYVILPIVFHEARFLVDSFSSATSRWRQ